jgi:pimeloyl-ACP methyl ester carboxylesterase
MTAAITHSRVRVNGIDVHLAEAGDGPPAVLLHGFPELTATQFLDRRPMERAVSSLRSAIIPICGHWIHQERPQAVNDEILAFLDASCPTTTPLRQIAGRPVHSEERQQ